VLLMRTLSKFGLAGVRLGYMLGPKALIAEIDKVRPPYNVSVLNYEARCSRWSTPTCSPGRRPTSAPSAPPCRGAGGAAGRAPVPERGQHDPGAGARRRRGPSTA
jgi:hypothetical protein